MASGSYVGASLVCRFIVFQHEQAKRGRKVPARAVTIDLLDQCRYRKVFAPRYILQRIPELSFQGDGGVVSPKPDGAFDYG
jgi:hypothetical protein